MPAICVLRRDQQQWDAPAEMLPEDPCGPPLWGACVLLSGSWGIGYHGVTTLT